MSEEEAAEEGQAWSNVRTKGRYMHSATAFFGNIQEDPKYQRIKIQMDKVYEVLQTLTLGGGVNHPHAK